MAVFTRLKQKISRNPSKLGPKEGAEDYGYDSDFSDGEEYHDGVNSHVDYTKESTQSGMVHVAKAAWFAFSAALYGVGAVGQFVAYGLAGIAKESSWAIKAAKCAGKTAKHAVLAVTDTIDAVAELTGAVILATKKPLSEAASKVSDMITDGVDALLPPEGKEATEVCEMETLVKQAYDFAEALDDLSVDVPNTLFEDQVNLVAGATFNIGEDE